MVDLFYFYTFCLFSRVFFYTGFHSKVVFQLLHDQKGIMSTELKTEIHEACFSIFNHNDSESTGFVLFNVKSTADNVCFNLVVYRASHVLKKCKFKCTCFNSAGFFSPKAIHLVKNPSQLEQLCLLELHN